MTDEPGCKLRHLSDRLVLAQRPIRVLDAVQWPADAEARFLASGGRDLPHVPRAAYRPLRFDPRTKLAELAEIRRHARRIGGPAARLLARRCNDYRQTVHLLTARGTPEFAAQSLALYGRPTPAEDRRVRATFAALERVLPAEPDGTPVRAADAVALFAANLGRSLPAAGASVRICDGILSDAAAGCTYIKLRRGASFTPADLDLLLVHEGWTHVGTSLNGRLQPVCTFLAKGPPSTSCTQEGLAVLCELLAGVAHQGRLRRLARRYEAARAAVDGADFRDVYLTYLDATGDARESYRLAPGPSADARRTGAGSPRTSGTPSASSACCARPRTVTVRSTSPRCSPANWPSRTGLISRRRWPTGPLPNPHSFPRPSRCRPTWHAGWPRCRTSATPPALRSNSVNLPGPTLSIATSSPYPAQQTPARSDLPATP